MYPTERWDMEHEDVLSDHVNRVHSGRRLTLAVSILLAMAIVGGCGAHNDMVGTVTQIRPRLCVGRHAAMGACYDQQAIGGDALIPLHVGERVHVSVVDRAVTSVEPAVAADHRADCPNP